LEYNPRLRQTVTELTARFQTRTGGVEAVRQAYGRIYAMVQRQASVLAYIDTFWILATMCILAIGLLFLAKKSKPRQAAMGH